jgi:aarF domain-containing kinase
MPEPIKQALEKARAEANIMPKSQLKKILKKEYGENWKEKFAQFDEKPFAAASIGQVHNALSHKGEKMAIKIQYPGVAESIDSDLNNIKNLFN